MHYRDGREAKNGDKIVKLAVRASRPGDEIKSRDGRVYRIGKHGELRRVSERVSHQKLTRKARKQARERQLQ